MSFLEKAQVWNISTTKALIDGYKRRKEQFRDPKIKKRTLWSEITDEMKLLGYTTTVDALDMKFRNLKKTFKAIMDNNKRSSTGRGRITWPYYDDFYDIFKEDHTINPSGIIESECCLVPQVPNIAVEEESGPSNIEKENVAPNLSPNQAKPTIHTSKKGKSTKLQNFRKQQLALEERKVQHLSDLKALVAENNELLKKRNEIVAETQKNVTKFCRVT